MEQFRLETLRAQRVAGDLVLIIDNRIYLHNCNYPQNVEQDMV